MPQQLCRRIQLFSRNQLIHNEASPNSISRQRRRPHSAHSLSKLAPKFNSSKPLCFLDCLADTPPSTPSSTTILTPSKTPHLRPQCIIFYTIRTPPQNPSLRPPPRPWRENGALWRLPHASPIHLPKRQRLPPLHTQPCLPLRRKPHGTTSLLGAELKCFHRTNYPRFDIRIGNT
jgi:hypothetical protein